MHVLGVLNFLFGQFYPSELGRFGSPRSRAQDWSELQLEGMQVVAADLMDLERCMGIVAPVFNVKMDDPGEVESVKKGLWVVKSDLFISSCLSNVTTATSSLDIVMYSGHSHGLSMIIQQFFHVFSMFFPCFPRCPQVPPPKGIAGRLGARRSLVGRDAASPRPRLARPALQGSTERPELGLVTWPWVSIVMGVSPKNGWCLLKGTSQRKIGMILLGTPISGKLHTRLKNYTQLFNTQLIKFLKF